MDRKVVVFVTAAILLLLLGSFFVLSQNRNGDESNTPTNVPAITNQPNQATVSSNNQTTPTDVTINSRKLANNYFVFEKSEYEKAKVANRPILLFFYANWCPTCARQEPINVRTFDSLGNTNLIIFRVNYNDSETSSDEDNLAKELGIPYQHNFRLFDSNGKLVDSFQGDTSEDSLSEKLSKIN